MFAGSDFAVVSAIATLLDGDRTKINYLSTWPSIDRQQANSNVDPASKSNTRETRYPERSVFRGADPFLSPRGLDPTS